MAVGSLALVLPAYEYWEKKIREMFQGTRKENIRWNIISLRILLVYMLLMFALTVYVCSHYSHRKDIHDQNRTTTWRS